MSVTGKTTGGVAGRQVNNLTSFTMKWSGLVQRSGKPNVSIKTGVLSGYVTKTFPGTSLVTAPQIPNLWVENGVIWQLPSLLVGFTNYSSVTGFFSSAKASGMTAAPASWYQGIPFSASDFPILTEEYWYETVKTIKPPSWNKNLNQYQTYWDATHLLIWARVAAIANTKMFMSMSPGGPFAAVHGNTGSAGPIFPAYDLKNFSAQSPSGTKPFSAEYVMYVPGGIKRSSSNAGVAFDMSQYCWSTTPQDWASQYGTS